MNLYKAVIKQQEYHAHKHLHALERNCYHQHYKGGEAYFDIVLFHIVHLRRLTARSGRGYAAEKEAYEGIFQTSVERRLDVEKPEHILYYHRLPCHIAEHEHGAQCKPAFSQGAGL